MTLVTDPSLRLQKRPVLLFGKAEFALLGITMLWGTTFLIVQTALTDSGPLFFVGLRFGTAFLISLLVARTSLKKLSWMEVGAGSAIGFGIFIGYSLQTWGLKYIPSSTSAFITAAYVPLVPLLQWLILRKKPHLMSWIGVIFAFCGLLLLAGPQPGMVLGRGELMTLISTLAIAIEIVLISRWAGRVDAVRVTVVQLGATSLFAFAAMAPAAEKVPHLSGLLVLCACGLGLMSALIQLVMNWAQRTVSATRATLIYAGEPLWAGIVGRVAGERLPGTAFLGAMLIVAGVIVSEIRFRSMRKSGSTGPGHLDPAIAGSAEGVGQ